MVVIALVVGSVVLNAFAEIRHRALAIARRRKWMRRARPEGADIPQDSDLLSVVRAGESESTYQEAQHADPKCSNAAQLVQPRIGTHQCGVLYEADDPSDDHDPHAACH